MVIQQIYWTPTTEELNEAVFKKLTAYYIPLLKCEAVLFNTNEKGEQKYKNQLDSVNSEGENYEER